MWCVWGEGGERGRQPGRTQKSGPTNRCGVGVWGVFVCGAESQGPAHTTTM